MKVFEFQKIVLKQNANFILASSTTGDILYHEHFESRALSKTEIKEIIKLISTRKFSAYLLQVTDGNILPSDDSVWLEHMDLKVFRKTGISQIAYVSPNNLFNSFEMDKEIGPGMIIRIKIFKNLSDAVSWLQKQNRDLIFRNL